MHGSNRQSPWFNRSGDSVPCLALPGRFGQVMLIFARILRMQSVSCELFPKRVEQSARPVPLFDFYVALTDCINVPTAIIHIFAVARPLTGPVLANPVSLFSLAAAAVAAAHQQQQQQ